MTDEYNVDLIYKVIRGFYDEGIKLDGWNDEEWYDDWDEDKPRSIKEFETMKFHITDTNGWGKYEDCHERPLGMCVGFSASFIDKNGKITEREWTASRSNYKKYLKDKNTTKEKEQRRVERKYK